MRHIAVVISISIVVYCGVYFVLSVNGRYEPAAIGLNGVKFYGWAPYGFIKDYKWNKPMMVLFLPLLKIDDWFWHTSDRAISGPYPINDVHFHRIRNVNTGK